MESQLEKISAVECRVRVTIPWNQLEGRFHGKFKELKGRVRLPGFRPGKVPMPMLERLYGSSVRQELARDLVQETFETAVGQHDTTPLTKPVMESGNIERDSDFTYTARFEVAPSIEPTDYTGLEVRRRPCVTDDEKVQAMLEKKQAELTEVQPIPEDSKRTKTQDGDIWTVDIVGKLGSQDINVKETRVELGSANEIIPGFGAQFADIELSEVGSTKTMTFMPPQEGLKPEFLGQEATLEVALREVREKVVPELDDEFAKDTGEAESLEELRTNYAKQVTEEDQAEAEREARLRLVKDILERNDFDPAPSMIDREVAAQVDMYRRQLAQQGLDFDAIGTSAVAMADQMRPQASFNVKAFLLLDAIGKKEDIDVSDEELGEEIKEVAAERNQNPERLKAQMEKSQEIILIRAQMREERILDFLMEKSKVTEAPDPEPEADAEAESDS